MIRAMLPVFFGCLALASGCGTNGPIETLTAADTGCGAGSAQIGIYDGFQKIHCGCGEPADTMAAPGASLTCTVSSGTTVVFVYAEGTRKHQVVSSGTPGFPGSPVSDPKVIATRRVAAHAVELDTAGTYFYHDAFNNALSGRIIVQ